MTQIPQKMQDLLKDETKAFAVLATIMEDGSPQATPVWFSWDGENLLINSASGRTKDRNMQRDRRIALTILDPNNPYRFLQVRGELSEITTEGARDHINQLSAKYTGNPVYQSGASDEQRVIYRLKPEHVSGG
jgi:PPOX class probable F420-dependent enzyme